MKREERTQVTADMVGAGADEDRFFEHEELCPVGSWRGQAEK